MNTKSTFIVNPFYDSFFFIFSPLLALFLGFLISDTTLTVDEVQFLGQEAPIANIFIGTFIMAHLFLVFFRSHGNGSIFRQFPLRFTLIPVVLLVAMVSSTWVLVCVSVLATWWDVYHSSLQTFGIGRIYDAKAGNGPQVGRRLDFLCNLLLYVGPILAGASLMDHVEDFDEFEEVGSLFFTSIPAFVDERRIYLTWAVLVFAVPFLGYYLYSYYRLHRQGYNVSPQKVLLFASTSVCSLLAWGFNSFGEAFFIMNFFHALQYFALVWTVEKGNIATLLRLNRFRWGPQCALLIYLGVGFGYGLYAEVSDTENEILFAAILLVSILHFWYDGFIWSVRRRQI